MPEAENKTRPPRKCFHDFQMCCMFTGGPCDDGWKGEDCECYISKEDGDLQIKASKVFSMEKMEFVDKPVRAEDDEEEIFDEDWDD